DVTVSLASFARLRLVAGASLAAWALSEPGREPVRGPFPGVGCRLLVVGVADVAVEPVLGVGIPDDLVVDGGASVQVRAEALDVVDGDAGVGVPEQSEPRGLQVRDVVDEGGELREPTGHDAAAVE